jgi:molybdopterin-containing oxidoreductase family iron-sulfur binding subunit
MAALGPFRQNEFSAGASEWLPDLDRREFVKILGASLAFGGVAGCMRPSNGKIVPYVTPPENAPTAIAQYYATAVPVEGFARGIIVESNLGRPTKIEGNPDHPESLGTTDAITQAAILSLYDPERSSSPLYRGARRDWGAFEADWGARRAEFLAVKGSGIALLTEPTTSPSIRNEIRQFLASFPEAKWYQHTPLASYLVDGTQPDYDFDAARVVLAIGSDCLHRHPACLRYARSFAKSRRVENGGVTPLRFYSIESSPSVTGVLADVRLAASPDRIPLILNAIAGNLEGRPGALSGLAPDETMFASTLSEDLRATAPQIVCVAGPEQDIEIQQWALALNSRIGTGARSFPPVRSDADSMCAGNIRDLSDSLEGGLVNALFVIGSNPAYTSVRFREVSRLVPKLPFSAHLGEYPDETAALCNWHLPEAHFLETWGDLRSYDGTTTIMQPLIEPMFNGRSGLEVLRTIRQPGPASGYEIVRQVWEKGQPDFDLQWNRWLRRGIVDMTGAHASIRERERSRAIPILFDKGIDQELCLLVTPDDRVLDGRWSNNAWLQELPRPLTHLVWDNAVLLGPALAARIGVSNGDVLSLNCGKSVLDAAVWIVPGHADRCATLSLGYGRSRAGSVGNGLGFDAYKIRGRDDAWAISGLLVTRTGRTYQLVSTQHHFAMEQRDVARSVEPDKLGTRSTDEPPSLYPRWKRGDYSWGMSIDLSTCIGCSACVAACQAENNIPVVGKDQVSRGREMHWIRVDQYFEGNPANPRVISQPVTCMQCENAPCELVCPVGATVHNTEGLNEMVYNRCVGTRYCSNNCPYKVRRFNFLDYRSKRDSPENLQKNPDVTIRERGVMEKCTYCVQRINSARITAEKENRAIRDGDIKTACQQACPVEAIVFGNIADAESKVARRKAEPTDYALLAELNTRPRTTYLAKVVNPSPAYSA